MAGDVRDPGPDAAPEPKKEVKWFEAWYCLVPVPAVIIGAAWLGMSSWIALGAILGAAAGIYLGKRIPARSMVHVICLDLESKRVRILEMGRRLFSRVEKRGRPWLTLESGLGYDVIVARTYDDTGRILTYPEDSRFSDAAIMAMPARYRELISSLVELRDRVADQQLEVDLMAQRRAAEIVARFRVLFDDTVMPPETKEEDGGK